MKYLRECDFAKEMDPRFFGQYLSSGGLFENHNRRHQRRNRGVPESTSDPCERTFGGDATSGDDFTHSD